MIASRMVISGLALLLLVAASGCSTTTPQGDIYDMRRQAQVAYAAEEDQRSEALFLGLARAAPNDPETWFYLGNLYARTNRPVQAIEAYEKSLMLKSVDPRPWHNIGVVRIRQAWAAFIQAEALGDPNDPLRGKLHELISAMEKLPLDGLSRTAKPAAAEASK